MYKNQTSTLPSSEQPNFKINPIMEAIRQTYGNEVAKLSSFYSLPMYSQEVAHKVLETLPTSLSHNNALLIANRVEKLGNGELAPHDERFYLAA